MNYVPFDFNRHGQWVKEVIQPVFCEDTRGIVAEKDGKPVGAIILDSWTPNSVQCHIGVEDPMCLRQLPKLIAEYVFITANRKMLIGLTPSNNTKAHKINKHLGFKQVAEIPDAYADGIGYTIYQMTREQCKYLPVELRRAA